MVVTKEQEYQRRYAEEHKNRKTLAEWVASGRAPEGAKKMLAGMDT